MCASAPHVALEAGLWRRPVLSAGRDAEAVRAGQVTGGGVPGGAGERGPPWRVVVSVQEGVLHGLPQPVELQAVVRGQREGRQLAAGRCGQDDEARPLLGAAVEACKEDAVVRLVAQGRQPGNGVARPRARLVPAPRLQGAARADDTGPPPRRLPDQRTRHILHQHVRGPQQVHRVHVAGHQPVAVVAQDAGAQRSGICARHPLAGRAARHHEAARVAPRGQPLLTPHVPQEGHQLAHAALDTICRQQV
mmetsp:Transcript_18400/g.46514  ORF Transcript_18400/g.46514 Transcript_18400/m.46514 type:complete len:249 (-) Transcript_18400:416-1162(-)